MGAWRLRASRPVFAGFTSSKSWPSVSRIIGVNGFIVGRRVEHRAERLVKTRGFAGGRELENGLLHGPRVIAEFKEAQAGSLARPFAATAPALVNKSRAASMRVLLPASRCFMLAELSTPMSVTRSRMGGGRNSRRDGCSSSSNTRPMPARRTNMRNTIAPAANGRADAPIDADGREQQHDGNECDDHWRQDRIVDDSARGVHAGFLRTSS